MNLAKLLCAILLHVELQFAIQDDVGERLGKWIELERSADGVVVVQPLLWVEF